MAIQPIVKISMSQVDELRKHLDQLPERQESMVTKVRAFALLASTIERLRKKRYTWAEIAAALTESGLPITAGALQSYVRRAIASARRAEPPPEGSTRRSRSTGTAPSSPRMTASPASAQPDADDAA